MSLTSPLSSMFEDEIAELLAILLCWRHKKDLKQVKKIKDKWTHALEEIVRKGGDEVMGEADDEISRLGAEISDLTVRLMRLAD